MRKKQKIEKIRKKLLKKSNHEKKLIKAIKILKKLTGSVQFRFYKPKTKKTEPNPNRKKTRAKSEKNRAKPKKLSQTGLNRFLS
jgi:hypothetical protein